MIKLFISYRRSDAAHAAQRARACLQAKFGADAVFIDREIPAGEDWAGYLRARLQEATDVIVLVGDAFLKELRRGAAQPCEDQDWLRLEIKTALEQHKKIYPVLIGALDMPGASKLPEDIRDFASHQAVFAREPAFEAAMAALARSIADERGWTAPWQPGVPSEAGSAAGGAAAAALWALAGLALTGFAGGLVQWLAGDPHPSGVAATFWAGALFVMTTLLWGLGPYLVFRAVAEVRARAGLPVHNLNAQFTIANLVLALLAGGTFLLMSTRSHWHLSLLGVMPPSPHAGHYAMQGVVLLLIVFAALAVALLEPWVRRWTESRRAWGGAALNGLALVVMLAALWFALSLYRSLPWPDNQDIVPMVGYFMLAPALSGLLLAWDLSQSLLGLSSQAWRNRALLVLAVALYGACTLGYFAQGPLRLFMATG